MYCPPVMGVMPSYEVKNFQVFFGNQYVPDAKWIGFKDLGEGYGKDGNHVFFMGQIMENVQPLFFKVVDNTYAKDNQHVFQYGRIVEGLVAHSFQPPSISNNGTMIMQSINEMPMHIPSYEVRDFKVFFGTQYLSAARWIDFTDLGQGYGKDGHHVFFMGQILDDAHPFSFEVLKQGYAKDNKKVFQNGRIIEGVKPFGFQEP